MANTTGPGDNHQLPAARVTPDQITKDTIRNDHAAEKADGASSSTFNTAESASEADSPASEPEEDLSEEAYARRTKLVWDMWSSCIAEKDRRDTQTFFRDTAKQVNAELYGKAFGASEYLVISVKNGIGRPTPGSNSLENWANAESIARLLCRLSHHKIPQKNVQILVFYSEQCHRLLETLKAVQDRLHESWRVADTRIGTVDSFAGEEAQYVIVDHVAAVQFPQHGQRTHTQTVEGKDSGDPVKWHGLTAFAKDPKRWTTAITRAMNGEWIFLHEETIRRTLKPSHVLRGLIENARERKVYFVDHESKDEPPEDRALRYAGFLDR